MLTYSLAQCNEDIIILGNSRAQHHYIPSMLSDSLKMSCFNAGQDGGHSIFLPYGQVEAILKRYKPKLFLLEFSPSSVYYDETDYDKLAIFLPYYNSLKFLRPLIELRGPFEKYKNLSGIYPFNSQVINIIRFNYKKTDRFIMNQGYDPIFRTIKGFDGTKRDVNDENNTIDSNKVDRINEILALCQNSGTQIIVIDSPVLMGDKNTSNKEVKAQILEIFSNHKIPFWDYSSDEKFVDSLNYFADRRHLNYLGSELFTKDVASRIKNYLDSQLIHSK